MIRNKKIIKILFLSLILLFCLHCKANSESNQAISSEKQSEISKVIAPEIKMAKGNTLIAFSKAKFDCGFIAGGPIARKILVLAEFEYLDLKSRLFQTPLYDR